MKYFSLSLMFMVLFYSCKTYYISTDSLVEQFRDIDSTKFRDVVVKGPLGESYRYKANPIHIIQCVDKNKNPVELVNSPSIEIRVTHKGKKTVMYFDRLYVDDSLLTGALSRFISSATRTIPLNEISKIEVQDGKKNYHYVEK
ncbi:MAG: hypothetical protein ACJ749_12295 [Flavisolibacter sp.]